MTPFDPSTTVRHPRFGRGQVLVDHRESVVVQFEHGIEACLPDHLESVTGLADRIVAGKPDPALQVVARVLGQCIRSVNDAWGVFSRSRIDLLPHQLWVCKRVLESWPTRWLVADDVGLGKTVEAGLILTPLLSSGRVRRLLILAPASLVEQWQVRMREMFDIRLPIYTSAADTDTSDFWNTQDRVIASAHTLRLDRGNRWDRLFDADPWDLVLIDEAHHMNVDDRGHRTLSYQLVEGLQRRSKIHSMVLFTGTPHRGKDKGFLSLLKLLRPTDFDPRNPLEDHVDQLRTVMIRNNKLSVTDMAGERLFAPVESRRETYSYSAQEARFYERLTEFISTGKAYADNLGVRDRRVVILILITMQKLASSSVAAVRRALAGRLARLRGTRARQKWSRRELARLEELRGKADPADMDETSRLEEDVAGWLSGVTLSQDEIPALEELLALADEVTDETKIARILSVVEQRFAGRSVLFFTEYKATQALLMSALHARFGDGCTTFINGDGAVEGVRDSSGRESRHMEDRRLAAERFNRGDVRFLVSTEAAGEGVDLQESCSALVHVDLPWNPMRLHQRVGRLHRYGQKATVEVVTVRNPDTIESRIWELLDEKLARINVAFRSAMDDPEDMRQLVIGMATPGMFTKVFADADATLDRQTLRSWFDSKTATFGGADAVRTVRDLVGHVARFDFQAVEGQIPRVDLPDLVPFVKAILAVRGRRPDQPDGLRLRFRAPREWGDDFRIAVADRFDLLFSRDRPVERRQDVAGVGLAVVDRAVRDAGELTAAFGAIGRLEGPVFVFSVRDRITGADAAIRTGVVGVQLRIDGNWHLMRDWELVKFLNPIADKPRSPLLVRADTARHASSDLLSSARAHIVSRLDSMDLPFELPIVEDLACLVPSTPPPATQPPPPAAHSPPHAPPSAAPAPRS